MLFTYHLSWFIKLFRDRDFAPLIVMALLLLIGAGIMIGEYIGFSCGFSYVQGEQSLCHIGAAEEGQRYFADAITLYVFEVFFAVVALIMTVASLISALAIFYFDRGLVWLSASPLGAGKIILARLPLYALAVSWPVIVLALPAIAAFAAVRQRGPEFFFWSALVLLSFLFVFGGLGVLLATVCMRILGRISKMLLLPGTLLLFIAAGFMLRFLIPPALIETFQAVDLELLRAPLEPVEQYFWFFPSHAFAEAIFRAGAEYPSFGWIAAAMGIGSAAVFAGYVVLRASYASLWLRLQEGSFVAAPHDVAVSRRRPLFPAPRIPGKAGSVIAKDLTSFFRNPRELTSAGFFVVLLLTFLVLLTALPKESGGRIPVTPFILALYTAAIGYFLATIGMRFLFTAPAQEFQHGWISVASPLSRNALFIAKFAFGFAFLAAISAGMLLATLALLDVPPETRWLLAVTSFLQAFGLSSLCISFGFAFPSLRTKDPERMSTTIPGLLTIALAIFFVALGAAVVWALEMIRVTHAVPPGDLFTRYIAVVLLFGFTALLFGRLRLQKIEL